MYNIVNGGSDEGLVRFDTFLGLYITLEYKTGPHILFRAKILYIVELNNYRLVLILLLRTTVFPFISMDTGYFTTGFGFNVCISIRLKMCILTSLELFGF